MGHADVLELALISCANRWRMGDLWELVDRYYDFREARPLVLGPHCRWRTSVRWMRYFPLCDVEYALVASAAC